MGISGTPDLLGCVGPLFVAIEIKTDEGVSSALQIYKRKQIAKCGSIAMVITPKNMAASLTFLTNLSKRVKEMNGNTKRSRNEEGEDDYN